MQKIALAGLTKKLFPLWKNIHLLSKDSWKEPENWKILVEQMIQMQDQAFLILEEMLEEEMMKSQEDEKKFCCKSNTK